MKVILNNLGNRNVNVYGKGSSPTIIIYYQNLPYKTFNMIAWVVIVAT